MIFVVEESALGWSDWAFSIEAEGEPGDPGVGGDEGDAAVSNFAMASLATAASLIVATSFWGGLWLLQITLVQK